MEAAPTIETSRHKCLIYDGHPSEQLPVIVPLLVDGLLENRRCLYLGSPEMVEMVRSALVQANVDIHREVERGALIFSSDRSYLDDGFNPAAMVSMLCKLVDEAVQDGFQGLCATGDMRWELRTEKNFEKLLEYEARLEKVFHEKPLKGICQYHRNMVPAQAIQDALLTHRSIYMKDTLNRDNLFYMPPEVLLENRDKRGEWMCQQILRVLQAEDKRDKALLALTESEAQQRRLAEELAKINLDLERRIQERTLDLAAANKELEAFSYSVSHDLRAPLRAIGGFSKILVEDFSDRLGKEGCERLERILASVQHMDDLISGMLTLARLAKLEMKHEPIDLSAMVEEECQNLRNTEPGRIVKCCIQKGLQIVGDRNLLRAVISNLLSNAWKFTSKRTDAQIECGKTGQENGKTVFFVRDNGAGFDMEHAQKLFSVFERLHSQKAFPGTGIGLATVRRIISRHGGRVWAESSPDKGATFFFTLEELPNQTNVMLHSKPSTQNQP